MPVSKQFQFFQPVPQYLQPQPTHSCVLFLQICWVPEPKSSILNKLHCYLWSATLLAEMSTNTLFISVQLWVARLEWVNQHVAVGRKNFGYKVILLHWKGLFHHKKYGIRQLPQPGCTQRMWGFQQRKNWPDVMKFVLPDRNPVSTWKLTDVELKALTVEFLSPQAGQGLHLCSSLIVLRTMKAFLI